MFKKVLAVIVSVCLSFSLFSLLAFPAEAVQNIQETENGTANLSIEKVSQVLSNSSNYFTENRGQWPEEILYIGQTDFGRIAFTKDSVIYELQKVQENTLEKTFLGDLGFSEDNVYDCNQLTLDSLNQKMPLIESHYVTFYIR